jgi:hypothetical protein
VSRTQRGVFAAVAAAIAIAAVVLVAGGGGSSPTSAHAVRVVDAGAAEPAVLEYTKGERVELNVRSTQPDLVHVHGYDLREPVRMGSVAHLTFAATIEGEFRIELERAKRQIAVLRVRP